MFTTEQAKLKEALDTERRQYREREQVCVIIIITSQGTVSGCREEYSPTESL
jgi:hypothetical protein